MQPLKFNSYTFLRFTGFGKVCELYNEKSQHGCCHTNSNTLFVAIALFYGENDFTKTIDLGQDITVSTYLTWQHKLSN